MPNTIKFIIFFLQFSSIELDSILIDDKINKIEHRREAYIALKLSFVFYLVLVTCIWAKNTINRSCLTQFMLWWKFVVVFRFSFHFLCEMMMIMARMHPSKHNEWMNPLWWLTHTDSLQRCKTSSTYIFWYLDMSLLATFTWCECIIGNCFDNGQLPTCMPAWLWIVFEYCNLKW